MLLDMEVGGIWYLLGWGWRWDSDRVLWVKV